MEVIGYEIPRSWDDKGMNWRVPDPRKADYIMAVREAIMERSAAAHTNVARDVMKISPWKPVSIEQVKACVTAVKNLCGRFFNREFAGYKDDWSDFPRMWTYTDLLLEEGCEICDFQKPGDVCEVSGEWLKRIRNALDRLHTVQCPGAWGTTLTRSGDRHDPPFEESIGDAFAIAFNDEKGLRSSSFSSVPSSVYAWSGNTHWRCPIPGQEEYDDNVDGYCGYAQSVEYRFGKVRSWLAERSLNLLAYALITGQTTPVSFSKELASSVFDAGESGFREGMNESEKHIENPLDMEFRIGNADSIPRNEVVPVSDFDDEGNATYRRSAKRGYDGKLWFFLDYQCENGFKFRKEE